MCEWSRFRTGRRKAQEHEVDKHVKHSIELDLHGALGGPLALQMFRGSRFDSALKPFKDGVPGYLLTYLLVISLTWHTTIASTLPRRSAPLSRG